MAKDIFDKTIFDGYRVESLTESAQDIIPKYNFDGSTKTTVFISHKHDDLDETKGLIGLLERKYNIKAYIDSLDKSMPKKTSGETASKIKQRINRCNKFILLATNGAVESKWCNWELGYGDAQKFDTDNIALFPIKPDKTNDYDYKGNEYMRIYPHIAYYYGSERYSNGTVIKEGFYVCTDTENGRTIVPLEKWLNRFLSMQTMKRIPCPDCEAEIDYEIGPDESLEDVLDTAELIQKIEGEEEVEKMDTLLSLALTGGDYSWI